MTEEPAPRAPHAPQAPHSPAPAAGEGVAAMDASAGRTALRERLVDAIDETYMTVDTFDACKAADAVLPVVEEALAEHMDERGAEQIERIQAERDALPKDERIRLDAADAPMLRIQLAAMARKVAETKAELERTSTAAAQEIWHKLGLNAVLTWKERAEQAETDRAELADRNRDLDAQLTRERQARLAAEAAVRRVRDQALAALTRYAAEAHRRKWAHDGDNQAAFDALHRLGDEILASRDRILAALDADQPKETPDA